MKIIKVIAPLLVLLIIGALVLSYKIDKPFWGHHDWNGVYWGAVARNYVRYGLLETKFAMVGGNGVLPINQLGYSFHYPPLFPLIWALFFKLFGVSEWSSRLMSISFSLGSLTVFYLLIKKYFDVKTAIISSFFWIVTPMFIYFGKMPVHEIPLMFFVLLAFYFYLSGRFKLLLIATITAGLITWPGYFIIPAITVHCTLFKKDRTLKFDQILILWATSFILFALFLCDNYLVTGSVIGGGLKEVFLLRVGGVSPFIYIGTLLRWSWTYYFLLVPLSVIGLLRTRSKILILFLTYALIYPIVFRDASFRHDYLLIYFWPFLALAGTLALPKKLLLFSGLILAICIFLARKPYTDALLKSNLYHISVEVGEKIKPLTLPTDHVLVVSKDPTVPFDAWFIGFYADRIASVVYQGTLITEKFDKIFYYFPDGSIKEGETINNNGIK